MIKVGSKLAMIEVMQQGQFEAKCPPLDSGMVKVVLKLALLQSLHHGIFLPLLPQLAYSILATCGMPYTRALYFLTVTTNSI